MISIISVIAGVILTALFGNRLAAHWQFRSWVMQQRLLGTQAELGELKRLVEEITNNASDRLYAMQGLSGSMAPGSRADQKGALKLYREKLRDWNAALNSFHVRLRLYLDYTMSFRLESEIHKEFVSAGKGLEQLVRASDAGRTIGWSEVAAVNERLSHLQGRVIRFSRDLLARIQQRRDEVYNGRKLYYQKSNLGEYSRFELLKALFVSDVDRFYVIRPA